MATNELKLRTYSKRMNSLSSAISSINQQALNSTHRIERFNDQIHSLSTRITKIRQGNYQVLTHLEQDQAALLEKWIEFSPEIRGISHQKSETVQSKTRSLQIMLARKRRRTDYNLGNLQDIELSLTELRLNLSELQSFVASSLNPLEKRYRQIDEKLRMAESTVTLVSQASFPWKKGETPITATKAKDLINDLKGVITLTNHRFIFEHEKEIVLKKRFFIVTEKKIVREVTIHKPIGMVTQLTKGRVGLLKGAGLLVEFTSESGIPEMKFDTRSHEADWMVQSYSNIISGKVDEELAKSTPESTPEQEGHQLVACNICGAPYTEEIYRGQTSMNCKFCGAAIALK